MAIPDQLPNQTMNTTDYPRCETCRFWSWMHPGTGVKKCEAADHFSDFNKSLEGEEQDFSSYDDVFTGPRFGCVHHQPRTQSTDTAR